MKRFIIRDRETKKTLVKDKRMDFANYTSAIQYVNSMPFGLGYYYEVWDSLEDEIIYIREVMK